MHLGRNKLEKLTYWSRKIQLAHKWLLARKLLKGFLSLHPIPSFLLLYKMREKRRNKKGRRPEESLSPSITGWMIAACSPMFTLSSICRHLDLRISLNCGFSLVPLELIEESPWGTTMQSSHLIFVREKIYKIIYSCDSLELPRPQSSNTSHMYMCVYTDTHITHKLEVYSWHPHIHTLWLILSYMLPTLNKIILAWLFWFCMPYASLYPDRIMASISNSRRKEEREELNESWVHLSLKSI